MNIACVRIPFLSIDEQVFVDTSPCLFRLFLKDVLGVMDSSCESLEVPGAKKKGDALLVCHEGTGMIDDATTPRSRCSTELQ